MDLDWSRLFVPQAALLEIFLRGTIVYLAIFAYFRLFRREAGGLGIADILVIVLVADAAQSALAGEEHSITAGLLTVATIAFWDFVLDWMAYHVPGFERIVRAAPLLLIRDGKRQQAHLKREMITDEDLETQLREQGIDDVAKVKAAYLEGDGRLSVLKKEERAEPEGNKKKRTPALGG